MKKFKSIFVEGNTLDNVYFSMLYELEQHGRMNPIHTGSYEGSSRLEFDFISGTIHMPTIRPLAPTFPAGVPPVTTDEKIEEYFVNYLMDGVNLEDNEHYRYATWINGGLYRMPRLRMVDEPLANFIIKYDGNRLLVPSQLEWIIKHYKEKGFGNNHCYITVGYPESLFAYDIPYKDESERQTNSCLRGVDTHIKKHENDWYLCAHAYFRSWDLYAAWPENLGGITLLMEYIAENLGVKVGPLSFSSLKGHCYDFEIKPLRAKLNKNT